MLHLQVIRQSTQTHCQTGVDQIQEIKNETQPSEIHDDLFSTDETVTSTQEDTANKIPTSQQSHAGALATIAHVVATSQYNAFNCNKTHLQSRAAQMQ